MTDDTSQPVQWEAEKKRPKRCPHDGGFCHHICFADSPCFRKKFGMSLSKPREGFPKDQDTPVYDVTGGEIERLTRERDEARAEVERFKVRECQRCGDTMDEDAPIYCGCSPRR